MNYQQHATLSIQSVSKYIHSLKIFLSLYSSICKELQYTIVFPFSFNFICIHQIPLEFLYISILAINFLVSYVNNPFLISFLYLQTFLIDTVFLFYFCCKSVFIMHFLVNKGFYPVSVAVLIIIWWGGGSPLVDFEEFILFQFSQHLLFLLRFLGAPSLMCTKSTLTLKLYCINMFMICTPICTWNYPSYLDYTVTSSVSYYCT